MSLTLWLHLKYVDSFLLQLRRLSKGPTESRVWSSHQSALRHEAIFSLEKTLGIWIPLRFIPWHYIADLHLAEKA